MGIQHGNCITLAKVVPLSALEESNPLFLKDWIGAQFTLTTLPWHSVYQLVRVTIHIILPLSIVRHIVEYGLSDDVMPADI